MDVEQMEREVRKQLEEQVGRRVSDDEWELFKRFQLEQATTGGSVGAPAAGWTGNQVAAFFAGVLAALAGAALLAEWDLVFSAGFRIPLGILVLLTAVAGFWLLLRLFGWDLWNVFFWGLLFVVPFGVAGGALVFKDRRYLTSPWDVTKDVWGGESSPAEVVGGGLVVASVVLFWVGRPRWAFLGRLAWFVAGVVVVSIAVVSIVQAGRPLAATASWLLVAAVWLLTVAGSANESGRPSLSAALGPLVLLAALGVVIADLVNEGRALETLLWVPLIAVAAVGCVLCLVAVFGEGGWRVRIGRMLVGLAAIAPALTLAVVLQVSPW